MNVIIVNDYSFVNGGAGKVAINMAILLSEYGHNVVLFTAVGPVEERLKKMKNLQVVCLQQEDILNNKNRLQAMMNGLWNRQAAKKFTDLIKKYDYNNTIIHIHTISKALSTSIIPEAKKRNFKVIYQMHDYAVACPNMGFYNFRDNHICNHKAMSMSCIVNNCDKRSYIHKCWRVVRQVFQKYLGGLPGNVDCYIAVSKFSANILKPYLDDNNKLKILPNIIDAEKAPRVKAEENSKYIYIGRLMPEKNPIILAKASNVLNIDTVFIGDGREENKLKMVAPKAVITGWLGENDIKTYIRKARALVFPSKCYECHPLTVMEALSNGIPVITSDACAAIEQVVDGDSGCHFTSDNLDSLCDAIKKFDADEIVEKYSKKAYMKYWDENVDPEQYYTVLMGIYNELLG